MSDLEVLIEVAELTGQPVGRLYSDMSGGELRMWHTVLAHRDLAVRDLRRPPGPG